MTKPHTLLMIRHGEKPHHGVEGVDEQGNVNPHGLIPKGWVRAGALVTLFAPDSTLPSPGALVTPKYSQPVHRCHLTVQPLSQRLYVTILSEHAVDDHPKKIVSSLLAMETGVVLMCWEHEHLVTIVNAVAGTVPVTNPGDVPTEWPGDRFDVIWRFDRDEHTGEWTFSSLDQQLLAGDL